MRLDVKFEEQDQRFRVDFQENDRSFDVDFGEIQQVTKYVGGEKYEGEYVVTPKVEAQTMRTKDKVLTDDVTVKAIPFFNVSNNSGGSTAYIGSEV